jgi:hypothetical protein
MTLMHLGGSLNVARNMSTEVKKEYGKPKDNKPGDTVSVRKPYRFQVTKGLGYQPQAITDQFFNVKVSQVAGVHFEWDSVERTLSLREVSELYAKPAGIALASKINSECAQFIAQNTFNSVGTPGTTPADEQPYLAAGDLIVQQGLPEGEPLALIVNRKFSSTFVHGVKALYNPMGTIGAQFEKGEMSDATLGYKIYRDQTIYTRTVGPLGGTPLVDASTAAQTADGGNNGTMTLKTKGWPAAAAARLNVGDRFTIANVFSVHPQTRQSTGALQGFVVLSAFSSDGTGKGGVLVAPAITPSGQYQNTDSAPGDGAGITVEGAANQTSPQGLLLHKNSFAFVCVPLANPDEKGVEMVSEQTDPETGISLSFIRAFDPVRRVHVNRFDMLYDMAPMYREMACAING